MKLIVVPVALGYLERRLALGVLELKPIVVQDNGCRFRAAPRLASAELHPFLRR